MSKTVVRISFLAVVFFGLLAVFMFRPSPIDAAAWTPPPAPAMTGRYAPNEKLKASELLGVGLLYGPEDVAVDANGIVYGGTQDGWIMRIHPDRKVEQWVSTGGRPLGLHFDASGNLVVCDAYKGLLSIDQKALITSLVTTAEGGPLVFTDDLDIANDGKIYFTDASSKWNQSAYKMDLMELRPYGRFLVYDPATAETTVLLNDLYFPNGVALSQNEDFVLVNETWKYRIIRYWLKGEKAGTSEVFVDNLPGFPDGISANRNGRFWLAIVTRRNATVDAMHPRPWLKNLLVRLPEAVQPKAEEYGFVLGFDEDGQVVENLQDSTGSHLKEITSVQQHNGYLYLGSLHNDRIGKYRLGDD